MKLRTFKIWLFLLPVIAVIGVLLFVQSSNNQKELERQLVRSISITRLDVINALSDYYNQVDWYVLRKGYSKVSQDEKANQGVYEAIGSSGPNVTQLAFSNLDLPREAFTIRDGLRIVNYQPQVSLSQKKDIGKQDIFIPGGIENSKVKGGYDERRDTILSANLEVPYQRLLRKQESNKLFDYLLLADSAGIIVHPKQWVGNRLFKPRKDLKDSLGTTTSGIYLEKIVFSDILYEAFISPISLEKRKLFIVGLFPEDQFQKVGLRVDFFFIAILAFALLVLLASIPILRTMKLSKGDRLTRANVINVGISLAGLTLLFGFAFSFFKNLPDSEDIYSKEVEKLKEDFDNVLTDSESQLEEVDTTKHYLERITLKKDSLKNKGKWMVRRFELNEPGQEEKDLKWTQPNIDLSNRNYVNYYDSEDSIKGKLYIDSHYSLGSGKLESVISKQDSSKINALVFRFGLANPDLLNKDTSNLSNQNRFLLIKESGKVLYKSEKIQTPINNIKDGLSSDKWTEMEALMRNNDSDRVQHSVKLYLNGYQYTAILQLVEGDKYDEKVWMVFLVNENLIHVFSALSGLGSISTLVGYVLFVCAVFYLRKLTYDSGSTFSYRYEWLEPAEKNKPRLWFLSLVAMIIILLVGWIYYNANWNHLHFGIFFCLIVLWFATLSYLLERNEEWLDQNSSDLPAASSLDYYKKLFISSQFILSVLLFGVVLAAYYSAHQNLSSFWLLVFLLGITLVLCLVLWPSWKFLFSKTNDFAKSESFLTPQRVFLCTWFTLIGLIPGYILQSKVQLFETQIWNQQSSSNHESEEQFQLDSLKESTIAEYELARRTTMAAITDFYDERIENFVAPDNSVIAASLNAGIKPNGGGGINYIWPFLLFLSLTACIILLIRKLQEILFYVTPKLDDGGEEKEGQKLNFIIGLDTKILGQPGAITYDVNIESEWKDIDYNKAIHLKNFHLLKDYVAFMPKLSEIISEVKKSKTGSLVISSGLAWKDIYFSLENESDRIIFSEIFSEFYFRYKPVGKTEKQEELTDRELIKKLRKNKAFYANLWIELGFEEKLVCYSFAHEGFFNPSQKAAITSLVQKGLIVSPSSEYKPNTWVRWKFFSPVFRKFIEEHVREEDVKSFKAYEKKNGNSTMITASVVSFVLICLALISIFERNFFNEAYTYLTGSLGMLGTLYSIFSQGFNFRPNQS